MSTALVPTQRASMLVRAVIALKAAVGIFRPGAAEEAYGMLARIFPGGSGLPPKRGSAEFAKAYSENAWLRAITERIAFSTASVTWKLSARTSKKNGKAVRDKEWQSAGSAERAAIRKAAAQSGELREITDHPMLDFLRNGNAMLSGRNVRALTVVYHDLLGEAYWIKGRNALGMPTTAWPVPPHWIQETPTAARPRYRIGYSSWQVEVPDADVVAFYNPDPFNPYGRGSGLAQAVADELDTDEFAARYAAQFFFNRARPDLIISGEGLNKEAAQILEASWLAKLRGVTNAFKPFFLSKTVSVQEIGQNLEQMRLVELRQHQRDVIMQVWGIPPEVMGVLENSNRATIESAQFLFNSNLIVPRAEMMRDVLQTHVVPEYDERLVLDYVSPLGADKEHQRAVMASTSWAFTVDEHRALADHPPKEDGSGATHMVPFGLEARTAVDDVEEPEPIETES